MTLRAEYARDFERLSLVIGNDIRTALLCFGLSGCFKLSGKLMVLLENQLHWCGDISRTSRNVRICCNQHSPARQRLLQLCDRNVRRRGTVGLFHVPEKRLQSRVLVSDYPPAREHLGVMEARYPDGLGGSDETSIEITNRWHGHSITGD